MQLYKIADNYTQAIHAIQSLLDEGEIDADSAADTLEGLGGELKDKAVNVALHIKNVRSDIEQLKAAKESFDARIKRAQTELDFFENYLDTNMRKAGFTEIKTDLAHIKYRKLPAVVDITGDVPEQYQRVIPEKREPDKRLIGDALKGGEALAFASLVDGRTKLEVK